MNRSIKTKRVGWLIFAVILSACSRPITDESTEALVTPTTLFTSTDFYTSTMLVITSTNTPNPIDTPMPANTPLNTETHQPTITTTEIRRIPEATLNAIMTVTQFLPICNPGSIWELSPDGRWITGLCERENRDGPYYLKVLNIVDGREWRIDFDMEKYGYEGNLTPVHWTSNGKYLYVTICCSFDGVGLIFIDGSALLRLNLINGETIEILPENIHTFSFSATGTLAYISETRDSSEYLNIFDLDAWEVRRISLDNSYCSVGQILWAPTEDRIVYQATPCNNYFNEFSMVLLNLKDGSQKQLVVSSDILPLPLKWNDKFPLYIDRGFTDSGEDKCYVLNLEVGELQLVACPLP